MPPNTEETRHESTLNFKYPFNRDVSLKTGDNWLDAKKEDDGAEGLWRVHDGLYDVTDFVDKHPGGRMWLELTKGTDITEVFETHHLTNVPSELLKKHFIREAKTPRNSPFSFKDDGFYRTLKRRVAAVLKELPRDQKKNSDHTMDGLMLGTFFFAALANFFWSYLLGIVAGVLLAMTTIAAHNYFHKRDNFRMYYFNLSMMSMREWRITHALSHHVYTNTIIDLEVSFVEPLVEYFPKKKSILLKYGSWIYVFLIWITLFQFNFVKKVVQYVYLKETRHLHWSDVVTFTLPLAMYLTSSHSIFATVFMWQFVVAMASLWFGMVGFNAAHHAPEIFHDGDVPRARSDIDWGIFQLDTISERHDIMKSPFLVLTNFGDHALHHFFPTVDHAVLNPLYPILQQTMKEFDVDLRMRSQLEMVKGQFLQLAREEPNKQSPGLAK